MAMEIVKGCVDAWVAAASSLSVDATVALYDAEDGVLLGTVDIDENAARKGQERVREYFTHFLDKDAVAPCFPPLKEEDVMVLSPELIAYNGYYSFKLTKNGETNVVHAKFTYLYRKNSAGEWKIMIHNSGMTPKPTETLDGLRPEIW